MAGKTRITSAAKKARTPKEKRKCCHIKKSWGLAIPIIPTTQMNFVGDGSLWIKWPSPILRLQQILTIASIRNICFNIETGYHRETSHVLPIGLQFFAKKSSDYKTTQLTPKEYAHVMSEIATWATEQQLNQNVFQKCIGNYIYTVENNGFGNFRIINRRKTK